MSPREALLSSVLLGALKKCLPYVARYESEHMSNVALDVYIEAEAAIALAEAPPAPSVLGGDEPQPVPPAA